MIIHDLELQCIPENAYRANKKGQIGQYRPKSTILLN